MNTVDSISPWYRFARAPLPLQAYLVFVLIALALSSGQFYAPSLDAVIIPYTGWLGLYLYMFTLLFAIAAILTPQQKTIYAVVAFLVCSCSLVASILIRIPWGQTQEGKTSGIRT